MTRRLADRYVLGDEIGSGGTSRVHTAHDALLNRQVAVKLLDARVVATADPAGRDRFLREGRTSAAFTHPNAVTVFDAGEDAGDLFIVMELIDGESLAQHLARSGPLPVHEVVRIARPLLGALSSAHAAGIVHRDVKPANVLLGHDGRVKLADFGIARRFDDLDESVTATGIVMGTPRYLAPEQATGADVTPGTDVYAMGILLYEMLTGRTPFAADSMVATALEQQARPAPDVLDLRPDTPATIADVVARSLERNPAERYADAVEMAEALEESDGVTRPLVATEAARPTQAMAATRTATPTQAMAAVPAAASGVRLGDTQVLRTPHDDEVASRRSAGRSITTFAAVFLAVAVLVAGAIVVASMVRQSGLDERLTDGVAITESAGAEPSATEASGTEPVVTEAPATEPAAAPEPEVTEPPTTEPAVTEPPPTDPAATEAPRPELIPGFPVTDDIEVFLDQLRNDPDLVGEAGDDVVEDLEEVLDERGSGQRDEAEELREGLAEWVDDGELHPAIAAALDDLLARLATPGNR